MYETKRTFPSLSEANYATWADNMEAYLCTKDLFTVTDGSEAEPRPADRAKPSTSEVKDLREWKSRTAKASGELWLAVEDEQKAHIRSLKGDPVKMWAKLKEVHLQKKPGARFNAYDTLFAIRKQEDESLTALMGRAHTALQSIQDHRPEGFTLEMLDQELECMALVRALPQEYNAFVSSLLLLDSLDLTKLRSAFQSEELQRSARNSDTTPLMALQAGLARCYFCGSMDHLLRDCTKMKEASSKAKEGNIRRGGRRVQASKRNASEEKDKSDNEEETDGGNLAHAESAGYACPIHT
jgi:hypothetical protein